VTLRDDILPVLYDGRTFLDDLGFRPMRIIVRTRTWPSGKIEVGAPVVSDLELTPKPKVKWTGDGFSLTVGPIMPAFGGGGYTPQQLQPPEAVGVDHVYVAIPQDGTEQLFRLRLLDTHKTTGYFLDLEDLKRIAYLNA
jgi:hypothetical protein